LEAKRTDEPKVKRKHRSSLLQMGYSELLRTSVFFRSSKANETGRSQPSGFRLEAKTLVWARPRSYNLMALYKSVYQNLRSRFGIERHPYTKSRIGQIPFVCMYVCMCNYSSQTTEPICIKIIPANRASDADCYGLLRFEIFTPPYLELPKKPQKGA